MKKVLLIASELGEGGAQRSVSLLSYYLSQYYDVTLCILSGTSREKFYKTCDKVIFVDPPSVASSIGKIKTWRYRISRLKEIKNKLGIDVAISFLEGPDYVNVLTKGGEKVILSIRGSKQFDKIIKGKVGWLRKKILIPVFYKKADIIVCVTHALMKEMGTYFRIEKNKMIVINNFYEENDILKKSLEPLTDAEQKLFEIPVIINSGRLHPQKEQAELINVFSRLRVRKKSRLLILGNGDLKKNLQDRAGTLGLRVCDWQKGNNMDDADVYFMGYQANPFKFYSRSKIFVLSSSWEGFPNVLAEALICGIPAVSTDCSTGPREILQVKELSDVPVNKPVRLSAGSLMPLLFNADEKVYDSWVNELDYWLGIPKPEKKVFDDLTKLFKKETILEQWKSVIDR